MGRILPLVLLIFLCGSSLAQSELGKIIETEKLFVRSVEQEGVKKAFLDYLADDGIIFTPNQTNGKDFWRLQKDSPALVLRTPAYADISANDMVGYTTGSWEFRLKDKPDAPPAYGQYVTIWQKQTDGSFKIALDIGVTHGKTDRMPVNRVAFTAVKPDPNERGYSPFNAVSQFYRQAIGRGYPSPYARHMADDIIFLRQDSPPVYGRKNAWRQVRKVKLNIDFPSKIAFFGSADLAYMSQVYKLTHKGKAVETGSMLQIWKFRKKKWHLVLDIFLPAPEDGLIRR